MDMQPPTVEVQALSTKVLEELNVGLEWRIRALKAEAKVKELEAELAKLKPKEDAH